MTREGRHQLAVELLLLGGLAVLSEMVIFKVLQSTTVKSLKGCSEVCVVFSVLL